MAPYWAELLERYAACLREGKVRQIQFEQMPFDESDGRKIVRVTLDFGEIEEAQVTAG